MGLGWKRSRRSTPNAAEAPTARSTARQLEEERRTTATSSAAVCDSTRTTASVTRFFAASVKKLASLTRAILTRYRTRSAMLKIKKIDHVAVCVADIDEAAARWRAVFGLEAR